MQRFTLLFLASRAVQANIELSWYPSPGCVGQQLSGVDYTGPQGCTVIDQDSSQGQSIFLTYNSPEDAGYEVQFYTDTDCTEFHEIKQNTACVDNADGLIKAYSTHRKSSGRKTARRVVKRSPKTIAREVASMVENAGHDLAVRDSDVGPVKRYDIGNSNSTGLEVRDPGNNPYLAATMRTLAGVGVSALSFSGVVTGCWAVGNSSPVGQYSCAAGLAVTAIAFIGSLYNTYQGFRAIRATLHNNAIELGIRAPTRRGLDAAENTMTLSHEEYMEYVLHEAGLSGEHIGFTKRDESVDQMSPAYKFKGHDGQDFIFHISAHKDGDVRHSISFAHDATLEKRQGYQGVRVKGGVDVHACQRPGGDFHDFPSNPNDAWDYLYKDLTCLVDEKSMLSGDYLSVDIMDASGTALTDVGISPWVNAQDENMVELLPACEDTALNFNQQCRF